MTPSPSPHAPAPPCGRHRYPEARRHGTRARVVAAGLALAVALGSAACSEGADTATSSTTTLAEGATTTTLSPNAERVGIVDLVPGQCWDEVPEEAEQATIVHRLPCDELHHFEVYALVHFEAGDASLPGAPFPGDLALEDFAEAACIEHFEPFVGKPWTRSELDFTAHPPTQATWESTDDREITCSLSSFYGDPLEGTMAGSEV